ncbi:hypothetical protein IWQ60_009890 [Tieghemiomyces parasiticus]|uniref:tRNA (cytosine(38)-C(5))-methyltransferase n=1 Tax=Tieghemiomyces parasiticus TaxID=78921 RepID=A0A9W7ZT59_9FUNG|nr:hypothetical protein IWQ60_009890 [Tieghemiomyces parasiticus]
MIPPSPSDTRPTQHYAWQQANLPGEIVMSFDVNTTANTYTRVGHQKGSEDPRARSFLFILELLEILGEQRPRYILIENVVGFEKSNTRDRTLAQLQKLQYTIQEFIINPLDIGVPNSRSRYYLLAKAPQLGFHGELPYGLQPMADPTLSAPLPHHPSAEVATLEAFFARTAALDVNAPQTWADYQVPAETLAKRGFLLDTVTLDSRRTCCFTKGYAHYAEGTGSVLRRRDVPEWGVAPIKHRPGATTTHDQEAGIDMVAEESQQSDCSRIPVEEASTRVVARYFTEYEIAVLMGFPVPPFNFPAETNQKQRYRLLGNSLNVNVVALLLTYLMRDAAE